jgi:hypothetical protein
MSDNETGTPQASGCLLVSEGPADPAETEGEESMKTEQEFESWIASLERGDLGFTYLRLYADAPEWVRGFAVNRFGKGTVFLPPRQNRPRAA